MIRYSLAPTKPLQASVEIDEDGFHVKVDGYYVLTLTREGRLRRVPWVGPETGLDLDEQGRVREEISTSLPQQSFS